MQRFIPLILCLVLAACNFPGRSEDLPLEDRAATIVALTMSAQPLPLVQTTPSRTSVPKLTPSVTGTATVTATVTPTYSTPILTVNQSTHCRAGPGQNYAIVTTLGTGRKAEIVGRYEPEGYWVIVNPDGAGNCWIWGAYSTPSGSHWTVPTMTPPPTPTMSPPAQPRNLQYTYFCTLSGEMTTTLTWDDRATNEAGYRIFRKEAQIAELPANSTSFTESISINPGENITYSVATFNSTGESARATISFVCQ